MGIPASVTHVVFGGALPGGEHWQSGFWVHGATPEDAAAANANAELWWGQLTAEDDSGAMRIQLEVCHAECTLAYVRVYPYPSGGPTAPFVGEHSPTALTGSGSELRLPNQVAMVVSLRTALSGRRHRGRMYLPCNALGLESSGNFADSNIALIAAGWATCFSDWNESGDNGSIAVVSQTGTSVTDVANIVVDSRPDIQRRRANRQTIAHTRTDAVTPFTP
jgi:hypothetical protein